jgi:FlgN protein
VTDLLAHLARQVGSARKLLGIVLSQNEAIRRQDVESLLARLADVQLEMRTREQLERERDTLLAIAAGRLGVPADDVDLDAIVSLMPPSEADIARRASAELRGLLEEIKRVHTTNRVLIRQELAFLDHLMRVLSGTPDAGYSPTGWTRAPQPGNAVDARV